MMTLHPTAKRKGNGFVAMVTIRAACGGTMRGCVVNDASPCDYHNAIAQAARVAMHVAIKPENNARLAARRDSR